MKLIDIINEATVSKGSEGKACEKIISYIGKKMGQDFSFVTCEEYENADGKFSGFLFVAPDDQALRINWNKNNFHSITHWVSYNLSAKPTIEVFVKDMDPNNSSFVRILPKVLAAIARGTDINNINESILVENIISYNDQTWTSPKEFMKDAAVAGWTIDQIQSVLKSNGNTYTANQIEQMMIKNGFIDAPNVAEDEVVTSAPGKPERVMTPPSVEKMKKQVDKIKYADPETVFEDLDSYVTLVAKGLMPALMITGQGGIGKSYGVEHILKQFGTKGEDYVIMKGKCTPINMYRFLYTHYNQIVVFDDCDSIFDSKDGINILKGALDSGENREISWETQDTIDTYGMSHDEIEQVLAEFSAAHDGKRGIPSFFGFEGAVIFISNLYQDDIIKKDRAILTRCQTIDIVLRAEDVINRIKTVLPDLKIYRAMSRGGKDEKDITDEAMKQEVFEFMTSNEYKENSDPDKEINFRTFSRLYMLRYAGVPNWKRLSYNK